MATWVAFRVGGPVLGEVEGKTIEEARLQAWARWGSSADRVQSKASVEIGLEDLEGRTLPGRRVNNDDQEDGS